MTMADELAYQILDADNHFNEPLSLYEQYIDPDKKDLAITVRKDDRGKEVHLYAGEPSKFTVQGFVDGITEKQAEMGNFAPPDPSEKANFMPGKLLNRLNPLKGLDDNERKELIAEFRHMSEAYGNRDLRLALMDGQGIEAALMYPNTAHDIEFEFADRVDAMYANARSFNRWVYEEVGYAYENRLFLPPYIPLADVDLAVKELETVMEQGAPLIQIKGGHAHGGRNNPFGGKSVADPELDPIWSRVNEAGIGLTAHLGGTDYQKYGADWSEDPELTFGDFTAFQWMMYWGDRPAMELTAGLILHNFFGRFPNINVCLSEMGTVWVPYTIRKMDHAFMMGRKAKWAENGRLDARPSEIFRQHFLVAPYPEENVQRVVAEVGIDPIVFGSDFPHGEGLAFPAQYVGAQLASFSEDDQRRIMRGNLSEFLKIAS
jgi:predicted TIM-barrel fold metal-dependent hydrolase